MAQSPSPRDVSLKSPCCHSSESFIKQCGEGPMQAFRERWWDGVKMEEMGAEQCPVY